MDQTKKKLFDLGDSFCLVTHSVVQHGRGVQRNNGPNVLNDRDQGHHKPQLVWHETHVYEIEQYEQEEYVKEDSDGCEEMQVDIDSVLEVDSEAKWDVSSFEPRDQSVGVEEIEDGYLDRDWVFFGGIKLESPTEPPHDLTAPLSVHDRDTEKEVVQELDGEIGDREKNKVGPEECRATLDRFRFRFSSIAHKRNSGAFVLLTIHNLSVIGVHKVKIDQSDHIWESVEDGRNHDSKIEGTPG